MKKNEIIIYTDGCSLGNPGAGGWAAVLMTHNKRKEIYGGFKHTTNNRMEMLAVIKALEAIKSTLNYDITLYSDSQLIIDAVNKKWLQGWERKGWKKADKSPVLNRDLWERLIKLLLIQKVKFVWVKGHSGVAENERCDFLSKFAAETDNLEEDINYIPSVN